MPGGRAFLARCISKTERVKNGGNTARILRSWRGAQA